MNDRLTLPAFDCAAVADARMFDCAPQADGVLEVTSPVGVAAAASAAAAAAAADARPAVLIQGMPPAGKPSRCRQWCAP
jgi:hypothetical protein